MLRNMDLKLLRVLVPLVEERSTIGAARCETARHLTRYRLPSLTPFQSI
jgi:hypothetical protein